MKPLIEARLYRDAGAVKRYHTKRTHRTQTVGEHTFGMLMLIRQVDAHCSKGLYNAILHHDLPELFTGDTPGPIKRAHPDLGPLMDSIEEGLAPLYAESALVPEEEALLKWADRMELVLWCMEEVSMGNRGCSETAAKGLGWILAGHVPECAKQLTDEVVAEAASFCIYPQKGAELEMTR